MTIDFNPINKIRPPYVGPSGKGGGSHKSFFITTITAGVRQLA
ncbi:MAG TPA: hypothetical protein VNG90_03770 [Candidatus Acidoferrum sp.]|nr:hypothetical protein [Candidatus Acidoferrum sp.]